MLLAVAAGVSLGVDLAVAKMAVRDHVPGDLRKLVNVAEVFAHGTGVAMILITALVLDPTNRRYLLRVATCAFGAGALAQSLKHLVPRIRPNSLVHAQVESVLDTFLSREQLHSEAYRQISEVGLQSFPSGHTATAFGLALGLAWLYPRGRWLFIIFATLAALQRIMCDAHYVSDTLAAAALAFLFAGICLDARLLGRLFDRFERSDTG
jgi:membrane-associated phospholipid phosphatase